MTAPKSYFGNLGASGGAVEMVASVLAFAHGRIPTTLNYTQPDAACPVNVVAGEPQETQRLTAALLSQSSRRTGRVRWAGGSVRREAGGVRREAGGGRDNAMLWRWWPGARLRQNIQHSTFNTQH